MSYSYVKSVFPNFSSSIVYDSNIYNNIKNDTDSIPNNTLNTSIPNASNFISNAPNIIPSNFVSSNLPTNSNTNNLKYYNTQLPNNINYTQRTDITNSTPQLVQPNTNDLRNYENYTNQTTLPEISSITPSSLHIQYTNHILECSECKNLLLKQFNIESSRIWNNDVLELISYIVFGIFILMALEYLK